MRVGLGVYPAEKEQRGKWKERESALWTAAGHEQGKLVCSREKARGK
jgi:hypothetical protein